MILLKKKNLYRASYVTSIHLYIWTYVLKDIARNKGIADYDLRHLYAEFW